MNRSILCLNAVGQSSTIISNIYIYICNTQILNHTQTIDLILLNILKMQALVCV